MAGKETEARTFVGLLMGARFDELLIGDDLQRFKNFVADPERSKFVVTFPTDSGPVQFLYRREERIGGRIAQKLGWSDEAEVPFAYITKGDRALLDEEVANAPTFDLGETSYFNKEP